MDIHSVDPKTLDVPFQINSLSFRYFREEEGVKLSVCRITSPHAFDELGRPIRHGLYDPALGPTCLQDGPCVTCGQSCISCPGHFGYIELPFAVPNPLLMSLHMKLLRSSCSYCYQLRGSSVDRDLLLARLYFEDSGHPLCSLHVEAFRYLIPKKSKKQSANDGTLEQNSNIPLVKSWTNFFAGFPEPLSRFLQGIDVRDSELIQRNIIRAARLTWRRACENGQLLKSRSEGWREVSSTLLSPAISPCSHCLRKPMRLRKTGRNRIFRSPGGTKHETLLSCTELERHIAGLWSHQSELFDLLFGLKGRRKRNEDNRLPHRHLFVRNVLVPPSRFRPTSKAGSMSAEHPQNLFYQTLLTEIDVIMAANEIGLEDDAFKKKKGKGQMEDENEEEGPVKIQPTKTRYAQAMMNIQQALYLLYDSSQSSSTLDVQNVGIRQQLEKKTGLFRQHMMGKRVNFSCRSVIGPDVFLDTDEIGIPESFAKHITIPEAVTPRNVESMRRAVLNGPDIYPGAMEVEDVNSNGEIRVTKLRAADLRMRKVHAGLLLQNRLEKTNGYSHQSSRMDLDDMGGGGSSVPARLMPKRVRRHLKTGDIVLFNRQPTLHRVSIMAHKVRVLPGDRTIRFHYANCGSYNADFDGDEMNVHIPQDYLARAEAEELMLSSKHYIVPTSGAPIRGLIQDHIAAATLLSRRDTFIDRNLFIQLLYSATEKIMLRPERLGQKYTLPMPAILKPIPVWTGKQLISSILLIVRNGKPGIFLESGAKTSANVVGKEESRVIFRDGELVQGVIDKSSLGSSMYGIVHGIQETYGSRASDDFLTCMGRLCLHYMRIHGHTTGVADLELRKKGDRKRSEIIAEGIQTVGVEVTNVVYAELSNTGETTKKARTKKQARRMIEEMVRKHGFEAEDRLDSAMKVALSAVSSAVTKACVPAALRRPFPENGFALMTNTGAKGGAVNASQISCLLGSTVLEGKRVPRMGGSGATLPCFMPYDSSPLAGGFIASRFLTGISPQEFFFHAMAGREGLLDTSLKTANSGYLQRCLVKHLEAVRVHYDGSVRDSDGSVLQFIYGDDGIDPCKSRWLTEKIDWQVMNKKCLEDRRYDVDDDVESIRDRRNILNMNDEKPPPGTLLEDLSPSALSRCGAISEKFDSLIRDVKGEGNNNPDLRRFLECRYQRAAIEPGEAVGVIAAQGVGEPSTQMTLNTFHHAGSSSAHVTLGIPRLRELLMTASKYPKTPSMTLAICKGLGVRGAERMRQHLQRIELIELMIHLDVYEKSVHFKPEVMRYGALRMMNIALYFPAEELYASDIGIDFMELFSLVKTKFIPNLNSLLVKEMKRLNNDGGNSIVNKALRFYISVAKADRYDGAEISTDVTSSDDDPEDEEENELETEAEVEENERDNYSEEDDDQEDDDQEDEEGVKDSGNNNDDADDLLAEEGKESRGKTNRRKTRRKERSNLNKNGDVSSGAVLSDEDDRSEYATLGYVPCSIQAEDKSMITFDWVLPFEVYGKLDMAAIVQEAAKCCVFEVDKIVRCFEEEKDTEHRIITEGSNLKDIFELGHELVDFDRLETNDMYGILNIYGVEAVRVSLIKEFVKVFDAYGIPVNIRHLSLIADYMTIHGGYRGFNRRSIIDCPSPFQRLTFETSINFLLNDALNASVEEMKNPSAAVALSAMTEGGSGGFQILQQVN